MGVLKVLANENKILAGGMQTTKKLHRTNAKLHKKKNPVFNLRWRHSHLASQLAVKFLAKKKRKEKRTFPFQTNKQSQVIYVNGYRK
jgi:hypothetical protein